VKGINLQIQKEEKKTSENSNKNKITTWNIKAKLNTDIE
jgi:hypothetical protein